MISYLELLHLVKNGRKIDLVELNLNCGKAYYRAYYDDGKFNYFGLSNKKREDVNFDYFLANSLLESQMFEKNIKIINNKKIEKIDFRTLNTQKEKNRIMKDTINLLVDEMNRLNEL